MSTVTAATAAPPCRQARPRTALDGAETLSVAGHHVYLGCEQGLVVADLSQPMAPRIVATLAEIEQPTAIAVQFRFAFVTDAQGLPDDFDRASFAGRLEQLLESSGF